MSTDRRTARTARAARAARATLGLALAAPPALVALVALVVTASGTLTACEDRTGGDVMTRPGSPIPDASDDGAAPDGDPGPPRDGGFDVTVGDAGPGAACPAGSTLRHVRTDCADGAAPLAPPAALASDLAAAAPGDVVSLAGMNESQAPCLPVVVCTPADAPTLLFSDSPEMPSQDGVLYADTVPAGRHRLYVYHANGGAALRKFPVVVLNQNAQAATVTIERRGLAAPSTAYVSVGKTVLLDWLTPRAPVAVTVPAGQRVLLDPALDALHASQDELVHAVYDVVTDRAVKISFVSVLANADAAATTAGLSLLARDVDHQRGTFANADVVVALAPVAGGAQRSGVQRLRLGLDEVDETLEGVDAPTGVKQRLLGNYGMLYRFALALPTPASAAVAPRGGSWGGVARVTDGSGGAATLVSLPTATATLGATTDAVAVGPIPGAATDGGASGGKRLELMTAGGSNLPIDLFLVTP